MFCALFKIGILIEHFDEVFGIGKTKTIDALFDIADAEKLFAIVRKYAEKLVLKIVCILIFVHENLFESFRQRFCKIGGIGGFVFPLCNKI